jgi:hypothetical protein
MLCLYQVWYDSMQIYAQDIEVHEHYTVKPVFSEYFLQTKPKSHVNSVFFPHLVNFNLENNPHLL